MLGNGKGHYGSFLWVDCKSNEKGVDRFETYDFVEVFSEFPGREFYFMIIKSWGFGDYCTAISHLCDKWLAPRINFDDTCVDYWL